MTRAVDATEQGMELGMNGAKGAHVRLLWELMPALTRFPSVL